MNSWEKMLLPSKSETWNLLQQIDICHKFVYISVLFYLLLNIIYCSS